MVDATRWGLIGSTGYAATACAPAVAGAEGAELTAVLGSDAGRATALAVEHAPPGAPPLGTDVLDEFLAAPALDAVWIASPTHLHHPQAVACLKAGKHVLLEKPLAASSDEAWDLVKTAAAAGVVLATGYQARYVPGHLEMKRLIDDGALGQVLLARTFYGVRRMGPPQDWRQHRATARWGALGDTGTHHVDLLRMLLGDVASAVGLAGHRVGYETEDTAAASLRFESGAVASLTVSMNVTATTTLVEVLGTDASLVATDTSPAGGGTVILQRPGEEPQVAGASDVVSFVAQVETVTRAARGEDVAYATGVDGARNIDVLEQILP